MSSKEVRALLAEYELATDIVRCVILILLYEKPMHGYVIMEALRERLGRAVGPAIVYPFLSQLVAVGYLKSARDRVSRRARTIYSLTPKGRAFSERVFERLSGIISAALEPSLSICANCGCRLYEPGHYETFDGETKAFCCIYCARAFRRARRK